MSAMKEHLLEAEAAVCDAYGVTPEDIRAAKEIRERAKTKQIEAVLPFTHQADDRDGNGFCILDHCGFRVGEVYSEDVAKLICDAVNARHYLGTLIGSIAKTVGVKP